MYEATQAALALADVLLPVRRAQWRLVEVKSSTSVKPQHLDDLAIRTFVVSCAGGRHPARLIGVAGKACPETVESPRYGKRPFRSSRAG